MKKEKKAS